MKRPPRCRASSALKSAVRTLPRCSSPVGLGANRVVATMPGLPLTAPVGVLTAEWALDPLIRPLLVPGRGRQWYGKPAGRQNARIRPALSPDRTNGKWMQSVTEMGARRPGFDGPISGVAARPRAGLHSSPGASGLVRGLRTARSVALAAVALLVSLGATQTAWAAEGQPASAGAAPASATPPTPAGPPITAVRVTTTMGTFVIELNADRAPLTVQNFVRYVSEGFYTNTLIHRVVGNFVVQGGGYDATTSKVKPTHEYVFNESGNGLQNKRGSVGMARSGPPHSANSQFYVNLADNSELDPLPTRWGYAVFGQVIEGMDVIERIGVIATGSVGPFKSEAPLKPIVIQKIEPLTHATSGAAPAPAAAPPPPPPPSGGEGDTPPPQ